MPRLYGWAKTDKRVEDKVTKSRKGKISLIAAITPKGIDNGQCLHFDGAVNGKAFTTYLKDVLLPNLKPGKIIFMDNYTIHHVKEVRSLIEQHGSYLIYLPTYSPDFNPIEHVFSKIKAHLKKVRAQTITALRDAFAQAIASITKDDVLNCFRHCGYL